MIAQAFQNIYLAVLIVLLVFNLTQRRHLDHGEKKRFASLGLAGMVLLNYASALVIIRFSLSDLFLIVPVLLAAFIGVYYRKSLFLFKLHCTACAAPLPIRVTLYHDDNLCPACRDQAETAGGSGRKPKDVSEIDWSSWIPDEDAALCFIIEGRKLLLIRKKKGLGAGKINMPGGRIEPGESAVEAAVRECREEVGVTPHGPEKRADLSFEFLDGLSLHCSAFFAYSHSGEPVQTDEADPFWCDIDDIPFDQMWEDDALWIPRALKGELLKGVFIFDGDRMLSKDIRTVDSFD